VNTFDFVENKSVIVFNFNGGISGDDAIDPGAPPVCGADGVVCGFISILLLRRDDRLPIIINKTNKMNNYYDIINNNLVII
jgi:hypothetical protein